MNRHWHRISLLLGLGVLSLALFAACGSDSESTAEPAATTEPGTAAPAPAQSTAQTTVAATLSEWDVVVDPATVPAGEVTFEVDNVGVIPHELMIIRTDLAEDALPVEGGVAVLDGEEVIGEVFEFAGGSTSSGTFTLEAGSYVLICNIPAHYGQGMHAPFTVE